MLKFKILTALASLALIGGAVAQPLMAQRKPQEITFEDGTASTSLSGYQEQTLVISLSAGETLEVAFESDQLDFDILPPGGGDPVHHSPTDGKNASIAVDETGTYTIHIFNASEIEIGMPQWSMEVSVL